MIFEWHAYWLWFFSIFDSIFISPTFLWIFYFVLPLKLAVLFSRHLEVLFHYLLGSITFLEKLTIGLNIWPSCSFQCMSLKVFLSSLISQVSLLHAALAFFLFCLLGVYYASWLYGLLLFIYHIYYSLYLKKKQANKNKPNNKNWKHTQMGTFGGFYVW